METKAIFNRRGARNNNGGWESKWQLSIVVPSNMARNICLV